MTSSPSILIEDENHVRIIRLNRPERRNAIDLPLRIALAQAIAQADVDDSVQVLVLTGEGAAFCSGGDIHTMTSSSGSDALTRAQAAQQIVRNIWATPKPVIAAVNGAAYGAGVALAAACDRVVADSQARFATTFTGVGLAGDMGIYASLPARIGAARTRQMLMLPDPVPATDAHAWGLVDRLAPAGEALKAALEDAHRLSAGPAGALGVIKAMLAGEPRHPLATLELEVRNQVALWGSADFAEGVAAYGEKRRPQFGS